MSSGIWPGKTAPFSVEAFCWRIQSLTSRSESRWLRGHSSSLCNISITCSTAFVRLDALVAEQRTQKNPPSRIVTAFVAGCSRGKRAQRGSDCQRWRAVREGEALIGRHIRGAWLLIIDAKSRYQAWRAGASLPEIARSSCPLTSSRTPHCHRHHEHNPRQLPREEPHCNPKQRTSCRTRVSEPSESCRTSRTALKGLCDGFGRHPGA
jgi:hypothetical protein